MASANHLYLNGYPAIGWTDTSNNYLAGCNTIFYNPNQQISTATPNLVSSSNTIRINPTENPMSECKKELATQTKITIDAMVQAGESDEFMCLVLYLSKRLSTSPLEVYSGMTDTWNEVQEYLGEEDGE